MNRRTLLGTAGALGVGAARAGSPSARADGTAAGDTFDTGPARAALRRLLPARQAEQFQLAAVSGPERFRVTGRAGRVRVAGTSAAVLLTGVHWYLKYTCHAQISWAGDQLDLPDRLPAPHRPYERAATVPHRFALNDTHDGYTAPYADWPRWERLIDVLALHGCNEVLVTPGTEAVYHRLFTGAGYTDAEARAWLPAPTHQPWWLLQNLSGYGGPVSTGLLARRTALARRVVDRLRELGMAPVLPGYLGTVPDGFARRHPGARTIPQGRWAGLRRPDWLDPRTAAFRDLAAAYYRHQSALFGEVDHVKMDLLHEGGDPGDVPVPEAARAVERALRAARPTALWIILGWRRNPRRELLDALTDTKRVLVVDGLSDLAGTTDRERDWGGVPYAFGTIPNFGGRTTLGAPTHRWTERFWAWRDKPGSALVGTAYMAEAAERDPAAFELFSELAWRRRPVDRAAWFAQYARTRYGTDDPAAERAFAALRATAYQLSSADGRPHDSVFAARPSLAARSGTHYATHEPAYDPAAFDTAFAALLTVAPEARDSDAYRYDLTDLARQALANRSWQLIGQLQDAYRRRDAPAFGELSALWLRLLRLSEEMTGAHRCFLLGPWLAEARHLAGDPAEARQLERTARTLITTWADRPTADGGRLAGYANRDWNGLIGAVYLPRWRRFLDTVREAWESGREPTGVDWYPSERAWTRQRDSYPVRPVSDPYRTAQRVREALAKAPYQGELSVRVAPRALTPGPEGGTLTAVFRNVNGLRATGRVDLTLVTPARVEPLGPRSVPRVAPGGSHTVRWRVSAPGGAPPAPLDALPYTVTAWYGPRSTERVRAVRGGRLLAAGPLADGLRTVSTNQAVFGQLGERYAIDGAGVDLWRNRSEFGAVYRERALAVGTSVTARVRSQTRTGPWARAGIVVGEDLARPHPPGLITLALTPAHGVALAHDADGDGAVDTCRVVGGVSAPVLLRLTRTPDGYLGELSGDGGHRWRTVGRVAARGGAARSDAGLFMTAAHGGSGARGRAEFDGWRLG